MVGLESAIGVLVSLPDVTFPPSLSFSSGMPTVQSACDGNFTALVLHYQNMNGCGVFEQRPVLTFREMLVFAQLPCLAWVRHFLSGTLLRKPRRLQLLGNSTRTHTGIAETFKNIQGHCRDIQGHPRAWQGHSRTSKDIAGTLKATHCKDLQNHPRALQGQSKPLIARTFMDETRTLQEHSRVGALQIPNSFFFQISLTICFFFSPGKYRACKRSDWH
jgi:hypothetical protein